MRPSQADMPASPGGVAAGVNAKPVRPPDAPGVQAGELPESICSALSRQVNAFSRRTGRRQVDAREEERISAVAEVQKRSARRIRAEGASQRPASMVYLQRYSTTMDAAREFTTVSTAAQRVPPRST